MTYFSMTEARLEVHGLGRFHFAVESAKHPGCWAVIFAPTLAFARAVLARMEG